MSQTSDESYFLPFTPGSSLSTGLHVRAALGGGPPHRFEIDTGSVGILVPRRRLGSDYQDFDPSLDTKFGYISSGKIYWGQWVKVAAFLGVPRGWRGAGDYPSAEIEVFAVDRPADFDGGMLGVGFAIGGPADGGPARNPLLHLAFRGRRLPQGYIVRSQGLELGVTSGDTTGFAYIDLKRNEADTDWVQPVGSLALPDGFNVELPVLIDTGIDEMLLWLAVTDRPPSLANYSVLPEGVEVTIAAPVSSNAPALQYSFITGDASNPMAPSAVEWRKGKGINTGRNVLAGVDYLYDAVAGLVGFRMLRKA